MWIIPYSSLFIESYQEYIGERFIEVKDIRNFIKVKLNYGKVEDFLLISIETPKTFEEVLKIFSDNFVNLRYEYEQYEKKGYIHIQESNIKKLNDVMAELVSKIINKMI